MTNWFISINGEQKGPYPTDQLRQLISDGFVARDSYVWREGMAQWQPLSQVRIADDGPVAPTPVQPSRESAEAQNSKATSGYSAQQENKKYAQYMTSSDKRILPLFLLFFFLAFLGVHRFYTGKIGTGILFIITIGGLGIWWIVDLIYIVTGGFTDNQGNKITQWM